MAGVPATSSERYKMKSTIDNHADRPAIESGLARRVALRKLAKRYGVSIDALHRHKKKLLRDAPEMFLATQARDWKVKPEELEALRLETSEGWLANVRADLGKVFYFRDICIADDDHQAAAQWTGHARKYLEMIGHAAEQLKSHSVNIQNNFYNSPDYWLIQRAILEALADHPAARAAVLRALEGMGSGEGPPMITMSASREMVPA
jgi:DNA repair ATPase RecN